MLMERVMGIEPTSSAWKAEVLPLNYTRKTRIRRTSSPAVTWTCMVEGEGFEPSKAEPADLQSAPFGHSGTPPQNKRGIVMQQAYDVNRPIATLAPTERR